jgi:hypothetical protein
MALDLKAIADALAARYAPGLVTPPTGYPNIVAATATPPNALTQFPSVVAWPNTGEITYNPGVRKGEHEFLVNFYYAKHEGDIPRESAALLNWLGVLLDRLHGQTMLGLAPIVLKAIVTNWTIGALVYAGMTCDGITLTVRVWTQDNVSLVP